MRQSHKLGEKTFMDWAGSKVPIVNPTTGEITEASVFVACLGFSSYTYAEAFENQKIPAWIASHTHAFRYFGGLTEIVVPEGSNADPGIMIASVASISYLGFLVAPPMIGAITSALSLRVSYTVIATLGLAIKGIAPLLPGSKQKNLFL